MGSSPQAETAALVAKLKSENNLASTVEQKEGKNVVTNPDSILVVLNKNRYLLDGYKPSDLVEPNVEFPFKEFHEKRLMRREAARALEKMFLQAEKEGIKLHAISGYRSKERQEKLFNRSVEKKGLEHASRFVAKPRASEHETGWTMDIWSSNVDDKLDQEFGTTIEGKWLAANAHKFGFIIRYLEGMEDVTGYAYEPWHIRFVGEIAAQAIHASGLALEQWLQ